MMTMVLIAGMMIVEDIVGFQSCTAVQIQPDLFSGQTFYLLQMISTPPGDHPSHSIPSTTVQHISI